MKKRFWFTNEEQVGFSSKRAKTESSPNEAGSSKLQHFIGVLDITQNVSYSFDGARLSCSRNSDMRRLSAVSLRFGDLMPIEMVKLGNSLVVVLSKFVGGAGGVMAVIDIVSNKIACSVEFKSTPSSLTGLSCGRMKSPLDSGYHYSLLDFDGVAAVGTENGRVLLVDLKMEGCACSSQASACSIVLLPEEPTNVAALRRQLAKQTQHLTNWLCSDQIGEASVTALRHLPQISMLATGHSCGGFALWNLTDMTAVIMSSIGTSFSSPVTQFVFQEPENDPCVCCYLWVGRSALGDVAKLHRPSTLSLYQLVFQRRLSGDQDPPYKNLSAVYPKFEMHVGIHGVAPAIFRGSRLVCCREIVREGVRADDSGEVTGSAVGCRDSTCMYFVWETLDPVRPTYHLGLFDLNQWYHQQMPAVIRDVSTTQNTQLPYMAFFGFPLDEPVCGQYGTLLDCAVDISSMTQFRNGILPALLPEQFVYPSAYSFNASCLLEKGVVKVSMLGQQQSLLASLDQPDLSRLHLDSLLVDLAHCGLLDPPVHQSTHPKNEALCSLLSVMMDNSLHKRITDALVPLANSLVGNGAEFICDWCWERTLDIKAQLKMLYADLTFSSNTLGLPACLRQIHVHEVALKQVYHVFSKLHHWVSNTEECEERAGCVLNLQQHLTSIRKMFGVLLRTSAGIDSNAWDAEEPLYNWSSWYAERKDFLASHENRRVKLMIDALLDTLQAEFKASGQDFMFEEVHYPPTCIQNVLSVLLLWRGSQPTLAAIIYYILLDMQHFGYVVKDQKVLDSIASSLEFGERLTNTALSLWHLDHLSIETSVRCMLSAHHEVFPEQMVLFLTTLHAQGYGKYAVDYLVQAKPPILSLEELVLHLDILAENRMLSEALRIMSLYDYGQSQLLPSIFGAMTRGGHLPELIKRGLDKAETDRLVDSLQKGGLVDQCLAPLVHLTHSDFSNFSRCLDVTRARFPNSSLVILLKRLEATILDSLPSSQARLKEGLLHHLRSQTHVEALDPATIDVKKSASVCALASQRSLPVPAPPGHPKDGGAMEEHALPKTPLRLPKANTKPFTPVTPKRSFSFLQDVLALLKTPDVSRSQLARSGTALPTPQTSILKKVSSCASCGADSSRLGPRHIRFMSDPLLDSSLSESGSDSPQSVHISVEAYPSPVGDPTPGGASLPSPRTCYSPQDMFYSPVEVLPPLEPTVQLPEPSSDPADVCNVVVPDLILVTDHTTRASNPGACGSDQFNLAGNSQHGPMYYGLDASFNLDDDPDVINIGQTGAAVLHNGSGMDPLSVVIPPVEDVGPITSPASSDPQEDALSSTERTDTDAGTVVTKGLIFESSILSSACGTGKLVVLDNDVVIVPSDLDTPVHETWSGSSQTSPWRITSRDPTAERYSEHSTSQHSSNDSVDVSEPMFPGDIPNNAVRLPPMGISSFVPLGLVGPTPLLILSEDTHDVVPLCSETSEPCAPRSPCDPVSEAMSSGAGFRTDSCDSNHAVMTAGEIPFDEFGIAGQNAPDSMPVYLEEDPPLIYQEVEVAPTISPESFFVVQVEELYMEQDARPAELAVTNEGSTMDGTAIYLDCKVGSEFIPRSSSGDPAITCVTQGVSSFSISSAQSCPSLDVQPNPFPILDNGHDPEDGTQTLAGATTQLHMLAECLSPSASCYREAPSPIQDCDPLEERAKGLTAEILPSVDSPSSIIVSACPEPGAVISLGTVRSSILSESALVAPCVSSVTQFRDVSADVYPATPRRRSARLSKLRDVDLMSDVNWSACAPTQMPTKTIPGSRGTPKTASRSAHKIHQAATDVDSRESLKGPKSTAPFLPDTEAKPQKTTTMFRTQSKRCQLPHESGIGGPPSADQDASNVYERPTSVRSAAQLKRHTAVSTVPSSSTSNLLMDHPHPPLTVASAKEGNNHLDHWVSMEHGDVTSCMDQDLTLSPRQSPGNHQPGFVYANIGWLDTLPGPGGLSSEDFFREHIADGTLSGVQTSTSRRKKSLVAKAHSSLGPDELPRYSQWLEENSAFHSSSLLDSSPVTSHVRPVRTSARLSMSKTQMILTPRSKRKRHIAADMHGIVAQSTLEESYQTSPGAGRSPIVFLPTDIISASITNPPDKSVSVSAAPLSFHWDITDSVKVFKRSTSQSLTPSVAASSRTVTAAKGVRTRKHASTRTTAR